MIWVMQQIVQYLWSSLVYKEAALLWGRNKASPFSLPIPYFLWALLESKRFQVNYLCGVPRRPPQTAASSRVCCRACQEKLPCLGPLPGAPLQLHCCYLSSQMNSDFKIFVLCPADLFFFLDCCFTIWSGAWSYIWRVCLPKSHKKEEMEIVTCVQI